MGNHMYGMFLLTGIDKLLAQHIAHLFIRDPLSVFEEKIHLDDANESDHFEVRIYDNQSTVMTILTIFQGAEQLLL